MAEERGVEDSGPTDSPPDEIYANWFHLSHTNSDTCIDFGLGGNAVVKVRMSFVLLKTLTEMSATMIQNFEEKTDMKIKTSRQIDVAMGASNDPD